MIFKFMNIDGDVFPIGNKNVIEHLNKEKLEINKCYLVNTKVDNGHVIKLKLLELYDSEAIFTRVERDKY